MSTKSLSDKWDADAIRALRQRYGDDREQFADRINCSVASVRFWEIARGTPNGPTLKLFEYMERELDLLERLPQLMGK